MSSACDEDATAAEVGRDGALSRWALGSLVLVALAASEITGAGTVASLPVAFITITLSAICSLESLNPFPANMKPPRRIRSGRDLLDFMQLWLHMLSTLSAAATCARIASATVDYMSEGRSRIWLFGYESHSLGEAWPDVLGLTVIIVVSAMFMLGLEYSTWFCVLLIICVTGSIGFFALVGSLHSDVTFWTHDRFLPSGWQGLLTTAAMCSFGFVDVFPKQNVRYRCARSTAYVLVPLASYCTVAIVFTLMTHFRELTETAIPLVRVFEARDVAWARPAMAAFSIVVVCLALTELCPRVYANVVTLAGHEWRVLAKSLAYENETTGSAVLAVFTAGSLSAILAFACPLSYLIRLLNVGPLLAHILQATAIIYDRYQPDTDVEDFPVYTDVGYSRLNKTGGTSTSSGVGKTSRVKKEVVPEPSAVKGLKFGLWFLPRAVRSTTSSFLQDTTSETAGKGKNRGQSEERECLLMGEYSPEYVRPLERQESNLDLELGSDGESECDVMVRGQEIEKDEDSSTDIDAIVEEYKERIKVATTLTSSYAGSTMRLPSLASGRRVLICVWLLTISAVLLGGGALFLVAPLCWSATGVMALLCAVIAYQPQRPKVTTPCSGDTKNIEKEYRIALVPWLPALAVAFNSLLAAAVLPEVWPGVILWIGAGLILFCRCDCWWCDCCDVSSVSSRRERIRLRAPSRGSVVSALVPNYRGSNSPRLSHVDTILIAR